MRPKGEQNRPPLMIRADRKRAGQRETRGPAVDSEQEASLRTASLGQDRRMRRSPGKGEWLRGETVQGLCGRMASPVHGAKKDTVVKVQ